MQHHFNTDIAKQYDIITAIMLDNFYYWINKNRANNKNFYNGRYWTFNTNEALAEMFPYLSSRQVRYAIQKMIDNNLIMTDNFNINKYDRTLYYAITDFGYSILQNCQMYNIYNITDTKTNTIKEIYKEKENGKDTAPDGANTQNSLGSAFLGLEDENEDTSFIATTALSNGQQQPSVAEKKETAKQQADNGTKASTTSGNLKTVKKITEAEIITYFAKTWEMYPRKVNKVQALKTYGYKLNGLSEEEAKKNANKIYTTLKKQIEVWASEGEHGREFEFMPHFSTWLNANFTDSNGKARCR